MDSFIYLENVQIRSSTTMLGMLIAQFGRIVITSKFA